MEKKLTQDQLKTLKLFSYYCQSYGCSNFNIALHLYNCELDYIPNYGYGNDGTTIELYDKIEELIKFIAINLIDYGKFEDVDACETSSSLMFDFDCKEKKLLVTGFYTDNQDNPIGMVLDGDTFNEDIISFMSQLKNDGLDEFVVLFDGAGDSGYIEETGTNSIEIPAGVTDYLYEILNDYYGGWEINAGSHGSFNFLINENQIDVNFVMHVMSDESLGDLFYIEYNV